MPTSLHFVMFHVFKDGPDDHVGQIDLAARSIRRLYPEARITLLTNVEKRPDGLPADVALHRVAESEEGLMLRRIVEYRDFVRGHAAGGSVVFLDTDILLRRRFDELLRDGADLVVTVRNWREQPINGGFYVANLRGEGRAAAFFDTFVDHCRSLSPDEQRWSGDQISLQRLLAPPRLRWGRKARAPVAGLEVLYVPTKIYNNTPKPWELRLGWAFPLAKVLHFKGERKRHMARYFARMGIGDPSAGRRDA